MEHWDAVIELLLALSPAHWCQAGFMLATGAVLAIAIAPSAERKLILNYGARSGHNSTTVATDDAAKDEDYALLRAVKMLTSLGQIPHSWFFSFYATYIVCAAFWATQYVQNGSILRFIAGRQNQIGPTSTMVGSQIAMVWCLMMLQAMRRLYECWVSAKPSKSTMWFVHWLLGLGFYVAISIAIWVEGSGAIVENQVPPKSGVLTADAMSKAVIALPLFFFGWVTQYRCHKHLAGLKKYSLPDVGLFRHLICPHYTCECLIYFSLAIIAAPQGQLCNRTLLSALVFVAANLGVTAHGTKIWYVGKFGSEKVAGRRILVPFLY